MFDPPVRVGLVQLVLPHYRVPVFRRLGSTPGLSLTVFADPASMGSLESSLVDTPEFRTEAAPVRQGRHRLSQPAQLEAAGGGRFDVLILTWNARSRELAPALKLARRRDVRTILWGHGYSKRENWLRRRFRNRLANLADAILLYNQTARHRLVDDGFDPARLFVALNAIDQEPIAAARAHWRERSADLDALRSTHGLDPSETVVFVSRLERDKGVDLLLRAFRIVADRRPRARLVIVGTGTAESEIRAEIVGQGLAERVLMTGAIYDDMDLAPYLMSAAVFAFPRAMGLSAMHAFGYGLPVVTCDDAATHGPEFEALRDGENARLYRPGDAADFARCMLECLDDPERRRRMSASAYATVHDAEGFTLERMVRGFTDAIRFVLTS